MTTHITEPSIRHWTLAEYYRLAEEGWFQGQRVQLLEGEIINMPPQGHLHCKALLLVSQWLREAFGAGYVIRTQMPLSVSRDSDPEPDIAVVRGSIKDFDEHPKTAVLVVEIADTSLRLDRRKAGIYAAAGVEDYWIVNLAERCLEIHRPAATASVPAGYGAPTVANESQSISPLAFAKASVKVADLLP